MSSQCRHRPVTRLKFRGVVLLLAVLSAVAPSAALAGEESRLSQHSDDRTLLAMVGGLTAADLSDEQLLVDKATRMLEAFAVDEGIRRRVHPLAKEAKALFVVPGLMKGAFLVGGAGGSGVLLVRDEATGAWSNPAFYTIGAASVGLQAGAELSDLILIVRTPKGLEGFYQADFKIGADISMAVGPEGGGVQLLGLTADLVGCARNKGVFAGIALDGAVISVANDSNHAYYSKTVHATDILIKHDVQNSRSAGLRNAAAALMK